MGDVPPDECPFLEVNGAGFCGVAFDCVRSTELKMCQCTKGFVDHDTTIATGRGHKGCRRPPTGFGHIANKKLKVEEFASFVQSSHKGGGLGFTSSALMTGQL